MNVNALSPAPQFGALGLPIFPRWSVREAPDGDGTAMPPAAPAPAQAPAQNAPAAPQATQAPAPAQSAAPDIAAIVARSKQRQAERLAKLKPATDPQVNLPDDVKKKLEAWDRYEAATKAKLDAAASSMPPEAKSVFDAIGDLDARQKFVELYTSLKSGAPAPAAPPARPPAGATTPPPPPVVNIEAIIAQKGIQYAEANYPREYAALKNEFAPNSRRGGLASIFASKKK